MKHYIYQILAKKRYYINIPNPFRGIVFPNDSKILYGSELEKLSFEEIFEKIKYYSNNEEFDNATILFETEENNYELIETIEQDISMKESNYLWLNNEKYNIKSTKQNEDGSLNVYIYKTKFIEEIGLEACNDFIEKVKAMKYIDDKVSIIQKAIIKIESQKEENEDFLGDLDPYINKDWKIPDIDDVIKDINKNKIIESVKRIFK